MPITPVESLEPRFMLTAAPLSLDGGRLLRYATNLGRVSGAVVVQDGLTSGEAGDYYSFTVRGKGNVNVSLSGLSANANLRLSDSAGNTVATSANIRARDELISRTLKAGTYYVGVERGKAAADTNFALKVQADLNYQTVDIGGDSVTLALTNADGTARAIDPARETWVVIHGWLSSPKAVHLLSTAIDDASKYVQVLELDWSQVASDVNPVNVVFNIPDVGDWVATKLADWGVPGGNVNLIGHSYGGYMTDEIARRVSGGVDRIVALDPATTSLGGIDFSGTNYAAHSKFSLAFIGSDKGTVAAAQTADETVFDDVAGGFSSFEAHGNVLHLFTNLTNRNNTSKPGPIAPLFALSRLHSNTRPAFKNSAVGDGYDAVLTGSGSGIDIVASGLTYVDKNTGQTVQIS